MLVEFDACSLHDCLLELGLNYVSNSLDAKGPATARHAATNCLYQNVLINVYPHDCLADHQKWAYIGVPTSHAVGDQRASCYDRRFVVVDASMDWLFPGL